MELLKLFVMLEFLPNLEKIHTPNLFMYGNTVYEYRWSGLTFFLGLWIV